MHSFHLIEKQIIQRRVVKWAQNDASDSYNREKGEKDGYDSVTSGMIYGSNGFWSS